MSARSISIAVVVILIMLIAALAFYMLPGKPSAPTVAPVVLQLTDPLQVPAGTEALNMSYSNAEVHFTYKGASGWAAMLGNGSINLLSIVNLTKTIASANIPANATVDMVRFNVTSASIAINGTVYPVVLPSSLLLAHIANAERIKNATSLLVDLSPAVASIYTLNSTIFVLVPSLRAVVLPNANASTLSLGHVEHIGSITKHEIEKITPNITITSAAISSIGNATSFTVTVKDNSNSSVVINHVMLFGNMSVQIYTGNGSISVHRMQMPQPEGMGLQGSFGLGASANATELENAMGIHFNSSGISTATILKLMQNKNFTDLVEHYMNASEISNISKANISAIIENISASTEGNFENITMIANASVENEKNLSYVEKNFEHMRGIWDSIKANMTALGLNSSTMDEKWREIEASRIAIEQEHFKVLNFAVASNGTLMLPFSSQEFEGPGYTLGAGQSATLTFSGTMSLGATASAVVRAGNQSISAYLVPRVVVKPVSGESYRIVVAGEEGARASTNVTAS